MAAIKKPNLKLLRRLAEGIRESSVRFDLPVGTLIRLLVRNDQLDPAKLVALEPDARESREDIPFSTGPDLQRWVKAGAERNSLKSERSYIEAVIDRHLTRGGDLVVLGSEKGHRL